MNEKPLFFEFTSYQFEPDKKRIFFNYKTGFHGKDPLFFTETITLPKIPDIQKIPKELMEKLLESLHLMLGISYYKLYCATKVRLPYELSSKEAEFWNIVYQKGLGEFFYVNKLDPKHSSPKFPYAKNQKTTSYRLKKNDRCLVGIGGGKDSIVSAELLKQHEFNSTAFVVTAKKYPLIDRIIKMINVKNLQIGRTLDSKLFDHHPYQGHVPISAIYAFLGVFSAVAYRYSYVVVSNEHSSNFGNVTYKGEMINHQWSKSSEFETRFQEYIRENISPDIIYFSLLRPFYEIRIAKMFSKMKKYFPYFSSCNKNFRIRKEQNGGLWCNRCPKCVFSFILLSAFLSKNDLIGIFKKNLYQDKHLLPLFRDVLGFGSMKPFDCVGTFEESRVALCLASKKFKHDFIVKKMLPKLTRLEIERVFCVNGESRIPEQYKLLGMERVAILGYGREGMVTREYLKKYYPEATIGILDAKNGKDYLKSQKNFDVAIKTPGIKKALVTIPYTTATNIFFSNALGKHTIIGVTGSKGKSTTASLIFAILKEAQKPVTFLGNIGEPMLQALLRPLKKGEIFVLELSSYQLDDIQFSPDIAVVTSLFPEHMDYHNGVKPYYHAKKNIIRLQTPENYFVYNPKDNEASRWIKMYQGNAVPFSQRIPLQVHEIPLLGEHNKNNIKAAISVANILGIKTTAVKKALRNFKGLPHRLERVGTFKGITFYDDANAATPEATIMAITSLKNIGTIFLGGEDRGYDFRALEKTIKQYKIKNVVLFPKSGNRIFAAKNNLNIFKTNRMEKAVAFAYEHTKKGSICLLSCASPSYSLWKNFEEKGNEFKKMVKKLNRQ